MAVLQKEHNQLLSKVPQVTIFFWLIKVLCTTVGETFSDFLSINVGLGLPVTTLVMGVAFVIVLYIQFKSSKYNPFIYWLTVVLISVFGTLITDNMTDGWGVPLEQSTIIFTLLLAVTFLSWYASEKTLSIHSIYTFKREIFYWLTILFTFALGTAVGDLYSEQLGLGYLKTGIIVIVIIACIFVAWKLKLNEILAFWIAYILTRPLGASLGDYLSQSKKNGGLELGATITSVIFLIAILAVILLLSVTKLDLIPRTDGVKSNDQHAGVKRVWMQSITTIVVLLAVGIGGYSWSNHNLVPEVNSSQTTLSGQLNDFIQTENNIQNSISSKDWKSAKSGADDLEHNWDKSEPMLRKMDRKTWTQIDGTIDSVLAAVRSKNPDPVKCNSVLTDSLNVLNSSNQ
ncbi:COG4705 family protein [Paenibacillus sp. MMO-58]|uniref:COG4705 family protein n=1 Tax=Paenibacillus sp. MMO-58 TaxID=3081290 RepID=UPI003015E256